MLTYRPVLFVIGILLTGLAVIMMIPAVVDMLENNQDWSSFFMSAFLTAFVGVSLMLTNRGEGFSLNLRQAFVLTASSWVSLVAFGALPFVFCSLKLSYTDAFFEAMSGITTTGASVISGLDKLSHGILLWRILLTGIGGIGIIVFAIAILPMLRIGGMQLFKTESSDKSDKIMPRMTQVSLAITGVYFLLAFTCSVAYWLGGMSLFDSITHAISTISTAGFSNHDKGFGFFESTTIDYTAVLFMTLSGMPFVLFIQVLRGRVGSLFKDEQVRWYLSILLASITIMALWLHYKLGFMVLDAIHHASFTVTAVMTTSGFTPMYDYSNWGSLAATILFMLSVVGGCTGGTSGAIKIFRFQILYQTAKTQLIQLMQPHAIIKMRYNNKALSSEVTGSVMSFIILYGFSFMMIAIILSFTGLDFTSSMSAAASSISNTGPGLGPVVGPMGSYSSLTDFAKWTLAFAMLLGRLEIFTVLILIFPKFWRD